MATERFANDVQTTLTADVTTGASVLPITSGTGFPTQPQFRVRVDNEIMLVTGGVGTLNWDVVRGAENSTAATHQNGTAVVHVLTAGALGGNSDPAANLPGLRSLGTGAAQAAAGVHTHAASDITSGTMATTRLGSGTASGTTFLRGDQSWATPAGGGGGTDLNYIPVMNYAVGDGTTDDTAAFQTAVNAAIAAGKPFYVNPGRSYLINGTVDITGSGAVDANLFQWIMPFAGFNGATYADFATKIICGNTTGPCIRFGSAAEFRAGIYVDGLKVWANANRFRQPMVQFGIDQGATDLGGFGHFAIDNLWADGRHFDTDAFLFHGALNGSVRTAYTQNMEGGVSFVLKADRTNIGNMTFEDCFSGQAPIGWILSEYNPLGAVLFNSVKFTNCKMLGPGDTYMGTNGRPVAGPTKANSRFVVGTVAATAAAGQKVVQIDATAAGKVAAGMWVTIAKANGQLWVDRLTNVASPNVTVTNNLPAALASGDQLVFGQWHTICGSGTETVRSVIQDLNHWENANGFLAQSVRGVSINRPFIGNGVGRGVYTAFGVRQLKLDGVTTTTGIEIPDNARLLHQGNDPAGGNQRNQVRNVCLDDWRTGAAANNAPTAKVIQVDGSGSLNPVAYNERFGGIPALLGVWHQDTTVAISQANVQLAGPHGSSTRPVRVPHYGALVGLQVALSTACSAGGASALVATVFKGTGAGAMTATSLTCTLDSTTNTTTNITEVENATVTLAPGDRIDVRITTSGTFAPTANNVDATVWIEQ